MVIQYNIVITIINLTDDSTSRFDKVFEAEVTAASDGLLYNNHHVLVKSANILTMFHDEIQAYCNALGIQESSIDIDEFEIVSLTDRVDVYFEDPTDHNIPLSPVIKCYIYPKNDALHSPKLIGVAYDSHTVIWSWPEDEEYAHYLIEEPEDPGVDEPHIIATLPIGTKSYTETNLEPDTPYTRRLINYTAEQTSVPSNAVTVRTETVIPEIGMDEYNVAKNYDFTSSETERESIEEQLEAFHSGIGDDLDLKIYKQMDADFYQKFRAYFEITGRRIQREKRYDQVGFNYKVCLEATEEIEEQEGEVTFDVDVYPREWVRLRDYIWATHTVDVYVRLQCDVFLRKEIPGDEPEECKVYKPKFKKRVEDIMDEGTPGTPPSLKKKPVNVVLCIDITGSITTFAGGTALRNKGACDLVDKIDEIATNNGTDAKFTIVQFKGDASVVATKVGKDQAKATINGLPSPKGTGTDWQAALNKCGGCVASGELNALYFFSDGLPNSDDGLDGPGRIRGYASDLYVGTPDNGAGHIRYAEKPLAAGVAGAAGSISGSYDVMCCCIPRYLQTFMGQARGTMAGYPNVFPDPSDKSYYSQEYINAVSGAVGKSGVFYWDDTAGGTWYTQSLLDALVDGGTPGTPPQKIGEKIIFEFEKWEEKDSDTKLNKYDIDHVKVVRITYQFPKYTFSNDVTKVEYSRDEQRAIIPEANVLGATPIEEKSLWDIIWAKVQATPEYADGYTKTIGTVEGSESEPDQFLIRGLYIQDTYNFADEDEITEANWGTATWEDGWNGSVNTFTDIDKLGNNYYGDDCYLVKQKSFAEGGNPVYIQGYTDAIIYEVTQYPEAELNYFDNPFKTLLYKNSAEYRNELINRKKKSLTFAAAGGSGDVSHCLDLIEIGDDIFFTGPADVINALKKPGDYIVVSPITDDLVAHNETFYESPVLNYRFNLEDPDAKTPLYEILPKCNPESNYLNIVILHIYYAKNVYITNTANYIAQWGDTPLATDASPFMPLVENLYQWTKKEWKDGYGNDNGWYIDDYLWFYAEKMIKIQDYYDELPGPGMETFYGLVNGRYRSDSQDGMKDLVVQIPGFNIPTTVMDKHADSVRIYIMITEFHPDTALVSYKWATPYNGKDSITQKNHDYCTFHSDSITYKDVAYTDIISTLNRENQEIFDNKTREYIYELQKPDTVLEYQNYYLRVQTDNSDVLAMRYPTELIFDENGLATVGVSFKGVVNATSQWAPRVHNGYYYLNQHEYYAYSEFDVEADFETLEESDYKDINGYVSISVQLRHIAKPEESYSITKDTRSELMQDESKFVWVNGKGLTLKPVIEGEYYKEYETFLYVSPLIMFPNVLTEAGRLKVDYYFEDGSLYLPMEIRSYDVDLGEWSEWTPFVNNSVPTTPLSAAYQVRFYLQASVTNEEKVIEDYLCCYLDWKDDGNEPNITNIVTITDHMTTGPDDAEGIYISKIIDYGCQSTLQLDMFDSQYKERVQLFVAYEVSNKDKMLLENINWINITDNPEQEFTGRYFRYKIVIPSGEKLYWLHKRINTLETTALLPYVTGISMTGKYQPSDVVTSFINTEAFTIPTDGEFHKVFDRVIDIIGADVLAKGYTEDEIEYVNITCTTGGIEIEFDPNILDQYPAQAALQTPINAKAPLDYDIRVIKTPYIFVQKDAYENDIIVIRGTPQQFAPITVEDTDGNPYMQIFDKADINLNEFGFDGEHDAFMTLKEEYTLTEETKYVELKRHDYENGTLKVSVNDIILTEDMYDMLNHLVIFHDFLKKGDVVHIEYKIAKTFVAEIDRKNDITTIHLYSDKETCDAPLVHLKTAEYLGQKVVDMFNNGMTFSYNTTSAVDEMHSNTLEEDWVYDRGYDTVIQTMNSSTFNGAINDMKISEYHHDVTLVSEDRDDDALIVIVGMIKETDTDIYHSISLVVKRSNQTHMNLVGVDCDNQYLLLVYDYFRPTQRVLATVPIGADPGLNFGTGWAGGPNGIRVIIDKKEDYVEFVASYWNDPLNINEDTRRRVELNTPETVPFIGGVYYGYGTMSQGKSKFVNITFNQAFILDENYPPCVVRKKYKVFFETNKKNNKFIAENLSLNPIYRTDYKGFIYLTDEHNDPYTLNIYCNPGIIKAGGYDKVDVSIEVLDIKGNPIIHKPVAVDCDYGILTIDDNKTDMNGVIHLVYESAYKATTDTLTARVITDNGSVLEKSITIISE